MDKALDQLLDEIEMSLMRITDEEVKKKVESELASLRERFEKGEIGEGIKNDIISLSVSAEMQTSGLRNVSFDTKYHGKGEIDNKINQPSYLTYIKAKMKEIDAQRVEEREKGYLVLEEAMKKYKIRSQEISEAIAKSEYQTMVQLIKEGLLEEASHLCQMFHSDMELYIKHKFIGQEEEILKRSGKADSLKNMLDFLEDNHPLKVNEIDFWKDVIMPIEAPGVPIRTLQEMEPKRESHLPPALRPSFWEKMKHNLKNRWSKKPEDVKLFNIPADKEGSVDKKAVDKMRKYALQHPGEDIVVNLDLGIIKIPSHAFSGISSIKKMFFPVSLEEIGSMAFTETQLEEIDLRNTNIMNWKDVSKFAFANCPSLLRVYPPTRFQSIGNFRGTYEESVDLSLIDIPMLLLKFELPENAWRHDDYLDTVVLPKNLKTIIIGDKNEYSELEIDPENPNFSTRLGVLYDKKQEKLICCPSNKTEIQLPESVREIGPDSFRKSNIKTLDASHTNLEKISYGAFYHCQQLESVVLPDSLTHIGQGAFAESKIHEIHLPKALNDIGYRAFQECHQLEEIDLSETEIEDLSMNTFQGCKNLTKIKLPKNLKRLSPIELEPVLDPYRGEFTKRKTVFSFMCPNLTEVEFPEEFARENPKIVEEIQRQLESNKARITKEKTKEKKPDDLPKETVSYGEDE